ncbi:hypothetical protein LSUE1_G004612 [Lachnellula suecica]|uniref:Uncharacterized protein n=1 Tax=Lachnellula suecica TaxID=602035 RepID=A0A8T9C5W5_9HELO|nr:hypothetical protein LSUE1_G004612 [Lachnellula suecica]
MDLQEGQASPSRVQNTAQNPTQDPIDPWASPSPRNQHLRQASSQGTIRFADEFYLSPASSMHAVEMEPIETRGKGLGINTSGIPKSIMRVPVGSRGEQTPPTPSKAFFSSPKGHNRTGSSPSRPIHPYFSTGSPRSSPQTPGSSKAFLSPLLKSESGNYNFDGGRLPATTEQEDDEYDISKKQQQSSTDDLNNNYSARVYPGSETERRRFENLDLGEQANESNGNFSSHDNDKTSLFDGCPAKYDIHSSRKSWLSISILLLSIYSTVFSGIYLIIALLQPRYGRMILTGGKLPPATASTLFALIAKTIELSFVTVFVTFLGQVLSRRSLVKASRGVTIAELTMRTWVIQPGFMITHWQTLQHAGLTILGVITLTAAFVAMFYTTASDALVSPHLKFGKWEDKLMYGLVKTGYANAVYVADTCQTPVTLITDPVNAGTTCLSVLHAGQGDDTSTCSTCFHANCVSAQHNFLNFLGTWTQISENGEGIPSDLSQRPQAPALMFDNTTVTGSWILTDTSNVTAAYLNQSRVINNVSMAMPHAGVIAATHQQRNDILQPEELDGVGEYSVKASVTSPGINVLCANMNATELGPLISKGDLQPNPGTGYLNKTDVDDIFEWGQEYQRQPPTFPKFPIEYNPLANVTVTATPNGYSFRDSVYLLIKAENTTTEDYTMCRIRSFLTSNCSTTYNVSGKTGGKLNSNCEDPHDKNAFRISAPNASMITNAPDWRDVGSQWLLALSLNTGISDANSSTARLLSQLIVAESASYGLPQLNPLMPSLAESLAVLAGSTLLVSSTDATFENYWNYTAHILDGTQLPFNASIASQEFTSGSTQGWQSMFYLVLILVFCTNVFCLIYFGIRAGLVTDYTEPQNLFALAVNSPASRRLEGSCGTGPEGDQFNVDWHCRLVRMYENVVQETKKDVAKRKGYRKNFPPLPRRQNHDVPPRIQDLSVLRQLVELMGHTKFANPPRQRMHCRHNIHHKHNDGKGPQWNRNHGPEGGVLRRDENRSAVGPDWETEHQDKRKRTYGDNDRVSPIPIPQ